MGKSWDAVYEKAAILTLDQSPRSSGTVYASSINQQQSLFILVTNDFGDNWKMIEMPDSPKDVEIYDLAVAIEEGREVLYLGTNKGVYSFRLKQ